MSNGRKKESFVDKIKGSKGVDYISSNPLEILYLVILILGIILSFFSLLLGAFLVGLAVGLTFWGEIHRYFSNFRSNYSLLGVFKTLILGGFALFLLIVLPSFIIGVAVGYGIVSLIHSIARRRR